MWQQILETALRSGLFAVLFVALLMHVLRDGRARELKYTGLIESLSEQLECVKTVQNDVKDIKKVVCTTVKRKGEAA